jgi:hypothetical protein
MPANKNHVDSRPYARSAEEILHACEILQRVLYTEGDAAYLPPGADANQCWGFMEAVQ